MIQKICVKAQTPYDVLIGKDLLSNVGQYALSVLQKPCKMAIITDDVVDALYGGMVQSALEQAGFEVCRFAFANGEKQKTADTWQAMLGFLADNHLTRSDCVVALGGGVVGDMAGFTASSYLRGIRFIQIATTLLAMVDSSVGGKTGFNLPQGKNLVGAFYQPRLVLCDVNTLQTLQKDVMGDGIAEMIKYGILGDEDLFEVLKSGDFTKEQEKWIARCIEMKAVLVEEDERDTGARQFLNLGHTLGHAVEKCSHFGITHGHAVGIGMVYVTRLAHQMGLCEASMVEALLETLNHHDLPSCAPYDADELLLVTLSDKKRMGDTLTFVMPKRIGECTLHPVKIEKLPAMIQVAIDQTKEGTKA